MVGVALNITEAPEQIEEPVEVIFTAAGPGGKTVIVSGLDVAGEPVAQPKLVVMITCTTSPFDKTLVVYVEEFVPTFAPLTRH